jgi:hypothetical protein
LAHRAARAGFTAARSAPGSARDQLIRELAAQFLYVTSGRAMAAAIAGTLLHYATLGWRFEQGKPPIGDAKRVLAHRILTLNNGNPIATGQIRPILAGLR